MKKRHYTNWTFLLILQPIFFEETCKVYWIPCQKSTIRVTPVKMQTLVRVLGTPTPGGLAPHLGEILDPPLKRSFRFLSKFTTSKIFRLHFFVSYWSLLPFSCLTLPCLCNLYCFFLKKIAIPTNRDITIDQTAWSVSLFISISGYVGSKNEGSCGSMGGVLWSYALARFNFFHFYAVFGMGIPGSSTESNIEQFQKTS